MTKKYRLGYCLWLLTGWSLPQRIQFLHDHGFRSVAKLQTTGSDKIDECREAARLIRDLGMTMTCHTNMQGNLKNRRLDPDFMRRAIADDIWWNEATGGAVVSCCSDAIAARNPYEFLREDTETLADTEVAMLKGTGIVSGIENSTSSEYSLPEQFNVMAAHSNAMLFDAGHAHIAIHTQPSLNGMTLEDYLDAIRLPVAEVHISDNHGEKDEHLAPKKGTCDYDALLRGLEKRPETPVISLEFCRDIMHDLYAHDLNVPEQRDRVVRAMDMLKEIFPH